MIRCATLLWAAVIGISAGNCTQTAPPGKTEAPVARIVGTAAQPDGTPAIGAIEVEPVNPNNPSAVAVVSNVDGSFETDQLPAGRYRVGVDLGIDRQPDEAYGKTYYSDFPGARDAAQATEIEISPDLPEPRIVFTVPKVRPRIEVRGTVLFEDGTPAKSVNVFFSPVGGYSTGQLWTDSKGGFRETRYGSVAYRIRSSSQDEKYASRELVVQPADLEKPIVLVLCKTKEQPSDPQNPSPPRDF
jgi:hypothetical protein